MPLTVHCPHCARQGTVPDRAAGKAATCPACGGHFDVPPDGISSGEDVVLGVIEEPPLVPVTAAQAFACPYCRSVRLPRVVQEVTTEAWIVFVLLLFVCFPLCFLPFLFMRKEVRYCQDCGMRLG